MKIAFTLTTLFLSLFSEAYALKDLTPNNTESTDIGKDSEDYTNASAEASHFITLLDQFQYESAWEDASPLFKAVISKEIWIAGMRAVRKPFDTVIARKVVSYDDSATFAGAVQGSFTKLNYRTQFRGGVSKDESITLMNVGYEQWRTVSYSLQ